MSKESQSSVVENSKPWLLSAAATAGVVSRSIVHPMDTLRANMMTWQRTTSHPVSSQAPNLQSLWNTFLYLMKQSGFKGLYRGLDEHEMEQTFDLVCFQLAFGAFM
ncbi:Mitochondrial substrate carrier family protein E [Galdieria sulphuraria]|nr:Mitochondrial substrate carrier family protein E [Galdieria sulphuraria]